MADIHYFGIRHHGPGSAKRLVAALDALQPKTVLIEGPSDCSSLLPLLAHAQMKPPVALLAYAAQTAACSIYYPFAEFSPEYQACLWACRAQSQVQFIDLPINIQLAQMLKSLSTEEQADRAEEEIKKIEEAATGENEEIIHDPIGILAKHAGYQDGEAWWNDLIEQNTDDSLEIFSVVESAMTALRDNTVHPASIEEREQQREAYMRLEIGKAIKKMDAPVAVVCGAWHVPALQEKHTLKSDREKLKTLPAKLAASKVKTTWIPWTSPRLASASGYGAGVDAPKWYQHLWQQRKNTNSLEYWLVSVTLALRNNGQLVSTASVIEAVRLSTSLAALRNRPQPGFEEIREAVVACLCFGEDLLWQQIEKEVLLGKDVGTIPPDTPLVPLLEDLQRLQKKNKLKPEALAREVSLDLRSEAGLGKSILLHQLNILEVPWGTLADAGKSRGTFRERWEVSWQPEYAVCLVESLVYGSTIEQAATTKISESFAQETHLGKLAKAVQRCLEAHLNKAAESGIARLEDRAAHAGDCLEVLESLPPLVSISRYGTARVMSLGHIEDLLLRLAIQAALALPYACRNLDDQEAQYHHNCINAAHQALELLEHAEDAREKWWQSFNTIVESEKSSLQITGLCARLLYQAQKMPVEQLQNVLQRTLSPAIPTADAARFFEGFFTGAVQRLLYDQTLLDAIKQWLIHLTEEEFMEFLPLFRRVFSGLDAMERKRMMDTVLYGRAEGQIKKKLNQHTLALWPEHFQRIEKLIKREKDWAA